MSSRTILRTIRLISLQSTRNLTTSSVLRADIDVHSTKKNDGHNTQQDAVRGGQDAKAKKKGGAATSEKSNVDHSKEKEKLGTKAPGPIIGMDDERGGKGE
ncbi:hypothetical protein BJ878DRAFT_182839 [Calycina marina]|uniref:Uncharacterized protein n=1 Tax=Calycina marina TaxID=1763456 RepID=A0A9P7Z979_9HELO|nr:hypothetical protein BJ878DRAFT_182839 [Calycina marina]